MANAYFKLFNLPRRDGTWPNLHTRIIWARHLLIQDRGQAIELLDKVPVKVFTLVNLKKRLAHKREISRLTKIINQLERYRVALGVKDG